MPNPRSVGIVILSAAIFSAIASISRADSVSTYATETSFQAAIGAHAFNDFNDLSYGEIISPTYTVTDATFGSATFTPGFIVNPFPQDIFSNEGSISTASADDPITISFSDPDLTAVGAIFYVSDLNGNLIAPYLVSLQVFSGTTQLNGTGGDDLIFTTSATNFLGFTSSSSAPITSIVLSFPSEPNQDEFMTFDNLYYGDAAVPLPSSVFGAIPLIGAILVSRWRKSKNPPCSF